MKRFIEEKKKLRIIKESIYLPALKKLLNQGEYLYG